MAHEHDCHTCHLISTLLAKKFMMPLLGHEYRKLSAAEVQPYLEGTDLQLVGGLHERGYTFHDVDVVGKRDTIERLSAQLQQAGIPHPIHYCGEPTHHSHLQCAYFGIKLALTGRGY